MILTIEILDYITPGEIIRRGTFIDSKEVRDGHIALCMPISNREVKWVAVKGVNPHHSDWCIYCENPHYQKTEYEFYSFAEVGRRGDKLSHPDNIRMLVPCSDEVLKRYRY